MDEYIRQEKILGSRCFSNYFWAGILIFGGINFVILGIESYFQINLIPFIKLYDISFIPQGFIMIFYGTIAITLSIYIVLTIIWNIGSGYNEYNKTKNVIKIVRKGFPGKNRRIFLTYPLTDIVAIGIKISDNMISNQSIFLCLKDNRRIPITSAQTPISISLLEEKATILARFLNLKLESL